MSPYDDTAEEPKLLIPAYFHPAVSDGWSTLVALAPELRAVVLNIENGPARRLDPAFFEPVRALLDAEITVLGYVNTDYGQRNPIEVAEEMRRYQQWYDVANVFFDRVSADWDNLDYYERIARSARDLGAGTVAFNHGVYPVRGYSEHADLLGTFESSWDAYVELTVPQWARRSQPGQFFHIVYGVTVDRTDEAVALAQRRNVGTVLVTERDGENPFDQLPAHLTYRKEMS